LALNLYRNSHFQHHRKTNTLEDPDFVFQIKDRDQHFPKSTSKFVLLLVRSALCVNFLPMIRYGRRYSPALNLFKAPVHIFPLHARLAYIVWIVATLNVLYWNKLFFDVLVLYVVPGFFWANFVNRVRLMAEHSGVATTEELNATRTVIPSWLDRLVIAPVGVSYHLEHHIFPFVPGHRLAELHRRLMSIETYRRKAHVTNSYCGVFRELTTKPNAAVTQQ
jgi:fatty acid desaturase